MRQTLKESRTISLISTMKREKLKVTQAGQKTRALTRAKGQVFQEDQKFPKRVA